MEALDHVHKENENERIAQRKLIFRENPKSPTQKVNSVKIKVAAEVSKSLQAIDVTEKCSLKQPFDLGSLAWSDKLRVLRALFARMNGLLGPGRENEIMKSPEIQISPTDITSNSDTNAPPNGKVQHLNEESFNQSINKQLQYGKALWNARLSSSSSSSKPTSTFPSLCSSINSTEKASMKLLDDSSGKCKTENGHL